MGLVCSLKGKVHECHSRDYSIRQAFVVLEQMLRAYMLRQQLWGKESRDTKNHLDFWNFKTHDSSTLLSSTSGSFLNNATNWEPSIQIYETIGAVLMQATSGSLPISEKVLWVSTLSGMLNVLELQDMHWSFTLCYAFCTMIFAGHAF